MVRMLILVAAFLASFTTTLPAHAAERPAGAGNQFERADRRDER